MQVPSVELVVKKDVPVRWSLTIANGYQWRLSSSAWDGEEQVLTAAIMKYMYEPIAQTTRVGV